MNLVIDLNRSVDPKIDFILALATVIAEDNQNEINLRILLNGNDEEYTALVQQKFKDLLPLSAFSFYFPDLKRIYVSQLRPDILYFSPIDESAQMIPFSIRSGHLHDLTPFNFRGRYFTDYAQQTDFYKNSQIVRNMDLLFASSHSAKDQALKFLGISDSRLFNISSAVSKVFRNMHFSDEEKYKFFKAYALHREYILYVTEDKYYKNNQRIVESFAKLPPAIKNQYQLILICKTSFNENHNLQFLARKYHLTSSEILFLEHVTDAELIKFYNFCRLFVFPSLYEDFPYPVLEAMNCGAIVIGSNSSSIAEIINNPDAVFAPEETESITAMLHKGLTDLNYRQALQYKSLQRITDFNWEKTAKLALESYKQVFRKESAQYMPLRQRKKIAFFSPFPNQMSGISYYSADLIPALSRFYQIDLYIDDCYSVENEYLVANYEIYPYQEFSKKYSQYHMIIYQMGNSRFHFYMYDFIKKYPGVIVMHDFYISAAIIEKYHEDPQLLKEIVYKCHGPSVLPLLDSKTDRKKLIQDFPLSKEMIDNAVGIIFHSQFNLQLLQKFYSYSLLPKVRIVPLIKQEKSLTAEDKAIARIKLGFKADEIIICSFGSVDPIKLFDKIYLAFIHSKLINLKVKLIFVGVADIQYAKKYLPNIDQKFYQDRVILTGKICYEQYEDYLNCADIAIQLRSFTRGETSAALMDCMARGIPTIVNAYATFNDYPDDSLHKISEHPTESDIMKALEELYDNKERCSRLAINALKYIKEYHNPDFVGREYYKAVEEFQHCHQEFTANHLIQDFHYAESYLQLMKHGAR